MAHRKPIVLIVEDDHGSAQALREQLVSHGYRVAGPFASNADALAYLGGARADVAILDLQLLDGLATPLAARLHQLKIPFCVVSGFERPSDPEFSHADWLVKPHDEKQLVDAVWHCLHVPGH